jgi:hypothetical protein
MCLNTVMIKHSTIETAELKRLIKQKTVTLGGNARLKIYGTLHCNPGKRMKKENRVFFQSKDEAIGKGFRPCGHCLRKEYLKWISLTQIK